MKRKLLSILALLCLTVTSAWAQSFALNGDDTWDATTKTLTVNSNPGEKAYADRFEIENLVISDAVTSIGNDAFLRCYGLTSITIPNSVTSIGNMAFAICSGLTSVTIGNIVESIRDYAFYGTGLTSVTIPNSVTSIGAGAFGGCASLTSIVVASGNTKYDSRENCNAIIEKSTNTLIAGCQNTIIPNSVTSIGDNAFESCDGLTSVTIPNSVISIGVSAFNECSGLTSVTIGNSVTSIGDYAFMYCDGLTSVTIPNSVISIGESAFDTCSGLTSVTIGNSVTSIGDYAFAECSGLTSITCHAVMPPTCGEEVFYEVDKSIPLYVPSGSEADYQAADQWGDFTNIQAIAEWDEATKTLTVNSNPGYQAYANNTEIEHVIINNGVTSIGEGAFRLCSNLTTVILNSNPTIGAEAFPASATVTMNLTANAAGGAYWMTFYNQNYDFEADANTQVFKAALTGTELELTELTKDKTVTKNNAVILKSTASPIVMTLTSTASNNDFSGNSLQGVSAAAGMTAVDPSTTFVLNNGTGGVGFYRLKSGKTVGVGKAYLTYDGAFAREFFLFDEATGIEMPTVEDNADALVYDLQGRRVVNPTKGLYIVNGKKVFINK